MATINSAQLGNWNTASTWSPAQVPTEGDTVNITHAITYDKVDDTNTIAAINLNAGGTLTIDSATELKIRFTNMVINGGKFIVRQKAFIRCLGGITVNNVAGSDIDIQGDEYIATSIAYDYEYGPGSGGYVGYQFIGMSPKKGDIISGKHEGSIWSDKSDIVYIAGHTNSVRKLVDKFLTIKSVPDNNTIEVEESLSTFFAEESGMAFMDQYGTAMDGYCSPALNQIVTACRIDETSLNLIVGERIYLITLNGSFYFRKIGSMLSSTATAGQNYVNIGSAEGWVPGDDLAIGGNTYANCENKIIQSITVGGGDNGGDRITFTTNLSYTHNVGGIVTKLNRSIVFHGNTTDTITNYMGYIYIVSGNTDRKIIFRNFEMRYYGNANSSYYYGLMTRATGNHYGGQFIEGCSFRFSGQGMIGNYSGYYLSCRNNVTYNISHGIGDYSSGYYSTYAGNIIMKNNSTAMMIYSYPNCSHSYTLLEGCSSWGLYNIYGPYHSSMTEASSRLNNIYMNYCGSCMYLYDLPAYGLYIYDILIKNPQVRILYNEYFTNGQNILRNVYIDGAILNSTSHAGSYQRASTLNLHSQTTLLDSINANPLDKAIFYYYGYGRTDTTDKVSSRFSWKFYPISNTYNNSIGFFYIIVPSSGSMDISISACVKKSANFNGTGPHIKLINASTGSVFNTVTAANNTDWQTINLSTTISDLAVIHIAGYGSVGNFWIDGVQVWTNGGTVQSGIFSNFSNVKQNYIEPSLLENQTNAGVRISGARL